MSSSTGWYDEIETFCIAQARAVRGRATIVGINAPQGAGKSTLALHLLPRFAARGLRATGLSIDDFYLTNAEQRALAAASPDNPYLEHRGYPGTHDVALGEATLASLRALGAGEAMRLPVYDKSAHGGRGDRAPADRFRAVTGPLDLVIVEGWMLGFAPVPEAELTDPKLAEPNRRLADYRRWHALIDAMVIIRPTDPRHVLVWRVEAEEAMKARGLPGLDRAAIEDYVRRFLPAYETWPRTLAAGWPDERRLELVIDERRVRVG